MLTLWRLRDLFLAQSHSSTQSHFGPGWARGLTSYASYARPGYGSEAINYILGILEGGLIPPEGYTITLAYLHNHVLGFIHPGYGSEALDFILGMLEGGLIRPQDIWLSHSGDGISGDMSSKLLPHVWEFLQQQDWEVIQKVSVQAQDSGNGTSAA